MQSWTCQHPKMFPHYDLFLGLYNFTRSSYPSCFSTDAAPLYKLLRNDVSWKWGSVEAKAFNKLKELLSSDSSLVHFDPSLPLGIACDASSGVRIRRTSTASGYSPSELLNNRQLRVVIDTLLPSPPHIAQSKLNSSNDKVNKTCHHFKIGDPCYALYFGPRRNQDPLWVPAVIVKRQGSRMFHVRVVPIGPIWRRHLNQLQSRYDSDSDNDIEDVPSTSDAVQEPSSE